MTATKEETGGRHLTRLVSSRLWHARWLLGVAGTACLALHFLQGGSTLLLVAILLALIAAAVAAPRQGATQRLAMADAFAGSVTTELSAASLAAAVADPLIVFDRHGAVLLANDAAESAFGGLPQGILLPLKFRAPDLQGLLERILTRQTAIASVDFTERVPLERAFRVTATAIGNDMQLFVLIFEDQSESRRIDRMRADFIANASHELRTPLASIAGFVETLRGPARNDPAAREQFLQIMQNQTSRMARLIDDLLSLSRLEMKALTVGTAKVNLAEIIDSVVDSLRPLVAESGVVIENQIGSKGIDVRGDRDELFQVFENLVENACKYGQSGGRVVISAKQGAAGEVGIEVRDFGPGIPAEHIPRITERFYRVDVESSRSQKGTGLGLSIVKHIVTRHRGRLAITSELGKGARFVVYLPSE